MSNAGKSASCAPSAMFSKSRNTAIVASESCTLIRLYVSDIAFARQRKLSQQLPWRLFRAESNHSPTMGALAIFAAQILRLTYSTSSRHGGQAKAGSDAPFEHTVFCK